MAEIFDVLARPYFVPLIAPASHAWLKGQSRLFPTEHAKLLRKLVAGQN
jgi:hypothetical protein